MQRIDEDIKNMSYIMKVTGEGADIWQNAFIYYMAKAIKTLLLWKRSKDEKDD